MARSTTLHDVAASVGVSARTVSRAVNGEPGLSAATRKRVLEAVGRMNYQTNMLARGLRANRSNTLGLVVTDLTDPFFPALAQSVQQNASQSGHTLILASTQNSTATEDTVLSSFRARGVDGTIIFRASESDTGELTRYAQEGLPMVLIDDQGEPTEDFTFVRNDLEGGARSAVRHLIDEGHRDIAMIANSRSPQPTLGRERGYAEEMREAGLKEHVLVVSEEPTVDGGAHAVEALLAGPARPTAVFAYNDLMAIGAMRGAQAMGQAVPEDLAVVGFDDIRMARLVTPMLSTVRIDREGLGQAAVTRLLDLIDRRFGVEQSAGPLDPSVPLLACELVIRESSTSSPPEPARSRSQSKQEPASTSGGHS